MGVNRVKKRRSVKTLAALLTTVLLAASAGYYKYDEAAAQARGRQEALVLKIAYLPITHALPLFETQRLLAEREDGVQIELVKYGGWSELMDALNTGRVDGASVLIEMAMKAKEQGIPLTLSLLGHRDGNVVITSNEIQNGGQLRGKTFAIPNPQSSHHILLQTLLEKNGLKASDVTIIEMAPAEMPSALQSGQIDGYCVAEPFGAQAVDAGLGHVFATSHELWPDSICCGIVLNQEALKGKEAAAALFEKAYQEAGASLTEQKAREEAEEYLGQKPDIAALSLQWISFQELKVTRQAYEELAEKVKAYGLSEEPPSYDAFAGQREVAE